MLDIMLFNQTYQLGIKTDGWTVGMKVLYVSGSNKGLENKIVY